MWTYPVLISECIIHQILHRFKLSSGEGAARRRMECSAVFNRFKAVIIHLTGAQNFHSYICTKLIPLMALCSFTLLYLHRYILEQFWKPQKGNLSFPSSVAPSFDQRCTDHSSSHWNCLVLSRRIVIFAATFCVRVQERVLTLTGWS